MICNELVISDRMIDAGEMPAKTSVAGTRCSVGESRCSLDDRWLAHG